MKSVLIVALLLITIQASGQSISGTSTEDFKKIHWLLGNWERSDMQAGLTGCESWIECSPYEFHGLGIVMKGKDTVFVEKLKIILKDATIYYVAVVPENNKPVYFKLTEITSSSVGFENPDHDFPKKISYKLQQQRLIAIASGDGKVNEFHFEKK